MAQKCTIEGVIDGTVTVEHLIELNAVLDLSTAYEQYAQEKSRQK